MVELIDYVAAWQEGRKEWKNSLFNKNGKLNILDLHDDFDWYSRGAIVR